MFTDPEIVTVGMTEEEAAKAGVEPAIGEVPVQTNDRALTLDDAEGFVRTVVDAENGLLLGAAVAAPDASELIAELALAVEMGASGTDVVSTIHTHPTLAETVCEAVMNATDHAIHATGH